MNQNDFPHEAYQILVHQVYKPVYLEKLAEYGIVPRTPQEELSLLEVAGILRNAQADNIEKTASQSPINEGADALKRLFDKVGLDTVPTSKDRLVKEAAAIVCANPNILDAAAIFGGYLGSLAE